MGNNEKCSVSSFKPSVADVFVLRARRRDIPRTFRIRLYPLPPLIFLAITGWTLIYIVLQRPVEALISLGIIVSGAAFYIASRIAGKYLSKHGRITIPIATNDAKMHEQRRHGW